MSLRAPLLLSLLFIAPAALAQDPAELAAMTSPWSGSGGELGFASARGNSNTESFNGRLRLRYTDDDWVHSMDLFGLRSRSDSVQTNEDGTETKVTNTTANRYTGSAGSALQLGEHRQITATVRFERDDFATYDRQSSFGLGYGTRLWDNDRFSMDAQIGPGVRRTHNSDDDETRTGLIGRGFFDMKYSLTANTDLVNTLLVESGSYNTFAQNDLGVSVSMNEHLALKAAWQARHNSDVADDKRKTDTLTTMNVVYKFK